MSLIQGALSRTATTAADMDSARAEQRQVDSRRLEFECDEATRDVLLKASVLVDMADQAWDIQARHLDALRDAVHRRDAAIAAKREAREHRSNS
ncbi:hypothetical protein DUY81_08600 [Acidipropionibacterium acidipropionici]|jgi:preprotein translocase subunit SecA|uniref:Uncharacterized protein n=1 Tax=Acidipropionibacterium acidipropionici TaxID=1748 RepID=A0AAC8YDB9_9ACTN|nr:hypothetical protein [Acidipropionibacterium acidipropionici]AMS04628.1 hypothetical protein AXH35_03180 [Acidipropionibacterium acidipropionici]AOZ46117.1 hypothetical protein A8L58_04645 [Acidipropionibacterium acidipropionici]AZP37853.1 hypothetical protein DUY81_08600 [Acidipropionibacterium acidipropionici]